MFLFQACFAAPGGTFMACDSPAVTHTKKSATEEHPLTTSISFQMDGVQALRDLPETNPDLSRFNYYPDPVFFKFSGDEHVQTFYHDEKDLELRVS